MHTIKKTMTGKDIVLITGANQGIGFEAVKALIASSVSYHVLLCGRSLERAKEAVASLQSAHPDSDSTLEALQVDITDDDSISNLFNQVQSSYGKIDVLINNAGEYRQINDHSRRPPLTTMSYRSIVRPRSRSRQPHHPRGLEQSLRRQRQRNPSHDSHLHAPSDQIIQPAPAFHNQRTLLAQQGI